jgi:hypothetical protein
MAPAESAERDVIAIKPHAIANRFLTQWLPSDPTGKRAAVFAALMVTRVAVFMILTLKFPQARGLPVLAVMPFVLALDLSLTAIIRMAPAR